MKFDLERILLSLATFAFISVGIQLSWNCLGGPFGLPELNILHGLSIGFFIVIIPAVVSMAWHSQVPASSTVQHHHYQITTNAVEPDTETGGS